MTKSGVGGGIWTWAPRGCGWSLLRRSASRLYRAWQLNEQLRDPAHQRPRLRPPLTRSTERGDLLCLGGINIQLPRQGEQERA
jgi:hypothetical protein